MRDAKLWHELSLMRKSHSASDVKYRGLELFPSPPQSCNIQSKDSLKVRHATKLLGSINTTKLVNDLAKSATCQETC